MLSTVPCSLFLGLNPCTVLVTRKLNVRTVDFLAVGLYPYAVPLVSLLRDNIDD
jgi:hypothetical protein